MSNAQSLLPNNATKTEHNLSASHDFDTFLIDIQKTANASHAPAPFLPFLAWSLSVDKWGDDWDEDKKRNSIKQSFAVHKRKGTPASIRHILREMGYGACDIVEGEDVAVAHYDGKIKYNGSRNYSPRRAGWAHYSIKMHRQTSDAEKQTIRELLAHTAPARCKLIDLQ